MTLLEEFVAANAEEDSSYYNISHDRIAADLGATLVHHEIVDITRWGYIMQYVYKRDNEFVSVTYEEASGDSDLEYYPEFTSVVPETIQTVIYR
jgi:hypothetical protein